MPVTMSETPLTRRHGGGPPPYGWQWAGGNLIPVSAEQHVRWLVLHLNAEGWSTRRIAAHLRELHVYNREGQNWTHVAVHRLIAGNVVAEPG